MSTDVAAAHTNTTLPAHITAPLNASVLPRVVLCVQPPAGFVLVKKVPGSIHFMDHADFFSFGLTGIDLTHTIHWFYFGARPSPNGYYQLQRLHPMGLHPDWLDKLKGRTFSSESLEHTHEHYLKVGGGGGGTAGGCEGLSSWWCSY